MNAGIREANPQRRVVHALIAVGVIDHRFWHYRLNVQGYHPELSAVTGLLAIRGFVFEQVQSKARRMRTNADNILFERHVLHRPWHGHTAHAILVWTGNGPLRQTEHLPV